MRLSEAIRLGSLTIEKPEATNVEACAITMALNSVGSTATDLDRYTSMYKNWPWLTDAKIPNCPLCRPGYDYHNWPLRENAIIYHLFDSHVMLHKDMTIEQLADFIASIEPQEHKPMSSEEMDRGLALTRCHGE